MPRIPALNLAKFAAELLERGGARPEEAALVAQSLVDANLAGHDSHGMLRLPSYLRMIAAGELRPGASFEVLSRRPAAAVCDAGLGFGQVQGRRIAELAVEMARQAGIGCVAARRVGHVGRLGEFVERVAVQGLAALMSVNDNGVFRIVAPPGSALPVISTNPLAISVPDAAGPLVFDASTSAVAMGKVLAKKLAGEPCPEGWLLDGHGRPTTDPAALDAVPPGTIRPWGGDQAYKGFGLGLMLDLLTGGLSGGDCPPAPADAPDCNNVLFLAWDPAAFGGAEHLRNQVARLADAVRGAPRLDGGTHDLPGERGRRTRAARLADGVPLPGGVWDQLNAAATEFGVARLSEA